MEDALKKLNTKAYTMTVKENKVLNQWLNKQLKTELIVKSSSQYAAPYFYIPKKDGSLLLVQNYWKLNQHMIKNKTLLPLIGEMINKLKDTKYFDKLCYDWHLLDAAWIWAKGNDNMISCTTSSSVSTSCSRCTILASSLCSMTRSPHVLQTLVSWTSCIYSIDTTL